MRLREWVERGRITTPPPAPSTMVVGLVVTVVAYLVITWISAALDLVGWLLTEPEAVADWSFWGAVGALGVLGGVICRVLVGRPAPRRRVGPQPAARSAAPVLTGPIAG